METLSSLRRQLQSAGELQSIVKSMKAMAAASIWQYERALASLVDYEHTVELGLQIVLRARAQAVTISQPPLTRPLGAVIFGSEQGMVGHFNDHVVQYALESIDTMHVPGKDRRLIAVGRRVRGKLENAAQPVAYNLPMPTSVAGIRPAVQQLMLRLDEWRATENIPRIVLFFNTPRDGNRYKPQGVQLVPVNLSWLQLLRETPWESSTLPTFDMPWGDLFSDLIQEYLYVAVYRAFAASLSAENSSRLASMESAEQNIAERLDDLEQQYHQVRQHSITSELLDIIAGAEAARRKM